MKQSHIFRRVAIYFFNGLLIILPIAGTFFLVNYVYRWLNELGLKWLIKAKIVWDFPGIGIIIITLFILLVGIIGRLWIFRQLLRLFEILINQVPLIKGLYNTLKEIIQSFIGEKKSFDQVVLVTVGPTKRLGFLTVKEPIFHTADGKEYLGVYFPHSMQVSGDLHWIEREFIEEIDLSVDEALKIILSAGVSGKNNKAPAQGVEP
ncbi:DUF502 domain-containing protein [Thermoflavimicrobium daqui]|uniref:DUF502 domain-containing protein n=1 Tax=Thermoflavimicrobium daqui TaxID=2137476 RepID=A0A364K685_9BACL|nr:DUF502 domain-containing protein [Thermoflavimicrobium daqui]RAL25722.1 hypothetical protein DL897_06510 [Thermoflavimicrobium daqui]